MSEPLISIIMPSYNHEKYVKEAVNSVIQQTYHNIELIVIDDGSKDSTWQILQTMKAECEKRFVRVVMEKQENQGTCNTLNKLVAKAEGDYIYLIASDDRTHPQAIEKLYKAIAGQDYLLAVGNEQFINADSQIIGCDRKFQPQPIETAECKTFCDYYIKSLKYNPYQSDTFGCYKSLLKRNYIPNGYLIKASAFKKVKLTKEAPLEDWYMHMQLAKEGKYKFVDEILFYYRLHATNTIANKERLSAMAEKTLNYEVQLCQSSEKFKKLFFEATIDRSYLNLGWLRIYKKKFNGHKKLCLKLGQKEFVLSDKSYSDKKRIK